MILFYFLLDVEKQLKPAERGVDFISRLLLSFLWWAELAISTFILDMQKCRKCFTVCFEEFYFIGLPIIIVHDTFFCYISDMVHSFYVYDIFVKNKLVSFFI